MKTLNLGIVMDQGADFSLVVGIFDESGPVDITGYFFQGQIRKTTTPGEAALATFAFSILDQVTKKGKVQWSLPLATIKTLVATIANGNEPNRPTTPYLFDVNMKDGNGKVSRIIQGLVEVSPQATTTSFP